MNQRQTIPQHLRYTINDFNRQFPDDAACLEHLKEQRFPGGIAHCEKCKEDRKHYRINGRPVYSCDHCGTQISPMAGTIFEHSSTPLRLWYYAMYLMASTRCGISAKQIQRETGVTYKTAWLLTQKLRRSMVDPDREPLEGVVEVDQAEIAFLGMESSPSFVRQPECNGCVERFIRTLKEQLLWVRVFQNVEELRCALAEFRERYNQRWIVQRLGYLTPAQARQQLLALGVAA